MVIKGHSASTMVAWWRKAVLANCDNTCAVCRNKWPSDQLEAHHLVSRHNRILRYDWRNGVAVCRGPCHTLADTRSGTASILKVWPHAKYLTETVEQYRTYKEYLKFLLISERAHTRGQLTALKIIAKGERNEKGF